MKRQEEPSQRQLKVGEEIRHKISDILRRGGLNHPGLLDATVTVSEVRMSPDLRHARVFVLPLGGKAVKEQVQFLNEASREIRHLLGRTLTMKYLPALKFIADDSFEKGFYMENLFRSPKVSQDLGENYLKISPENNSENEEDQSR